MTDRKETKEEQIRREIEETEMKMAIAEWKRKLVFSFIISFCTAAIIALYITILRSP